MLIDTSAGINRNVLSFVLAADEVILVTTPEPSSVIDAYAMIKTIFQKNRSAKVRVIVNMSPNPNVGRQTITRICDVAKQFLNCSIMPLGVIPKDEHVPHSVMRTESFFASHPSAPASRSIYDIARRVSQNGAGSLEPDSQKQGFFGKLVAALRPAG